MDYWHEITIPAGTAEADAVRETIPACPGTVKEVMLAFPKGQRGTTRARILRHEAQVWPSTPDAWYRGDGWIVEFPENYPMVGDPYEFIVEGYNSDADNEHTVMIRVTILEEVRVSRPLPPVPVYEGLV